MEKLPLGERPELKIIGDASEERKKEICQMIEERFGERHLANLPKEKKKAIEKHELAKTPAEIRSIAIANEITNRLREQHHLEVFDISERNFHYLDRKFYDKKFPPDSAAATVQKDQAIYLDSSTTRDNIIRMSEAILHETLHFKGYYSMEASHKRFSGKGAEIRRSGLSAVLSLRNIEEIGGASSFDGLDEALVAMLAKNHIQEMLDRNESLKEESEKYFSPEKTKEREKIARSIGVPIDEIMSTDSKTKKFEKFPYYAQRQVLDYLIKALVEHEKVASYDEGLGMFTQAYFTGKLLPLGRAIKDVFGGDALRVIGMMSDKADSARLTLIYLKKHTHARKD